MKKIKLHKLIAQLFKKLNENDDNPFVDDVSTNNTLNTTIVNAGSLDIFDGDNNYATALVSEALLDDTISDNCPFKVKLSSNFMHNVTFPLAPMVLLSLLLSALFPEKFFNVHKQLDNEPLKTIEAAPDEGINCFNNVKLEIFTKPDTGVNDSINYDNTKNSLNEGALALIGGIAAGAFGLNALGNVVGAITLGDDHGNYHENDKKLKGEKYAAPDPERALNTDSAIDAIDAYINRVFKQAAYLMKLMSGKSERTKIAELEKFIISLSAKAGLTVDTYIKDNSDILKLKEELERKTNELKTKDALLLTQLKLKYTYDILSKTPSSLTLDMQKKMQSAKNVTELSKVMSDNGFVAESILFNNSNVLNEADIDDNTTAELPVFDADTIYKEAAAAIKEKIAIILSGDEDEWPDVRRARDMMEEMKKGADAEIQKRIEIVCRTGSGDNLGATSKLRAFISKHPLRAEGLKNTWKRHLADLDARINARIQHIYNPDGLSPMGMCLGFLKEGFPNLIAMMITYKSIILIILDDKVKNIFGGGKSVFRKNTEDIPNLLNIIGLIIETTFAKCGNSLNSQNKPIYDSENHTFIDPTNLDIKYLGYFISTLIHGTKDPSLSLGNPAVSDSYLEDIISLHTAYTLNDPTTFFGNLVSIVTIMTRSAKFLSSGQMAASLLAMSNSIPGVMSNIEAITANLDKIFDSSNINNIKYILTRVLATKGKLLSNYNDNKDAFKSINEKSAEADKAKVRKALEIENLSDDAIDTETTRVDTIITDSLLDNIKNDFNTDVYIGLQSMFYKFKLNTISNDIMFACKTFTDLLMSNLSVLFGDDAAVTELRRMRTILLERGTGQETYEYLHTVIPKTDNKSKDISDNFEKYYKAFKSAIGDKRMIFFNDNGSGVLNGIKTYDDISKLAGFNGNTDTCELLLQKFRDDADIDNAKKVLAIMKVVLSNIVSSLDKTYNNVNTEAFDLVFNQKTGIYIGKDLNNNDKFITFNEFMKLYQAIFKLVAASGSATLKSKFKEVVRKIELMFQNGINAVANNDENLNIGTMNIIEGKDSLFMKLIQKGKAFTEKDAAKEFIISELCTKQGKEMILENKIAVINKIGELLKDRQVLVFANTLFGNQNGTLYKLN